jgi:Flp pilus assembly pilin Flp
MALRGGKTMSALAMRAYAAVVTRLGDTRRGATAVEYGLLVAFVAAVCVLAITQFGGATLGLYERLFTAGGPFQH